MNRHRTYCPPNWVGILLAKIATSCVTPGAQRVLQHAKQPSPGSISRRTWFFDESTARHTALRQTVPEMAWKRRRLVTSNLHQSGEKTWAVKNRQPVFSLLFTGEPGPSEEKIHSMKRRHEAKEAPLKMRSRTGPAREEKDPKGKKPQVSFPLGLQHMLETETSTVRTRHRIRATPSPVFSLLFTGEARLRLPLWPGMELQHETASRNKGVAIKNAIADRSSEGRSA